MLLLLVASVGGFLVFNLRHPWRRRAAIFMGNSGSMMLGFILAWFLVNLSQGEQPVFPPIVAVWIVGLPLMDTVYLMTRRACKGKNPCHGDRQHLHHILLALGLSDARVTLLLAAVSTLLGAFGLLLFWAGVSEAVSFALFLGLFAGYAVLMHRIMTRLEKHLQLI